MSVIVQIGNDQRSISGSYEGWIADQFQHYGKNGDLVCVKVTIKESNIDVFLQTPTCAAIGGSGGGRLPNDKEQKILELWRERGLNTSDFTQGNLIAFLKQLRKMI